MDSDEILKYALWIGGAYIVYTYILQPMMNPAAATAATAAATPVVSSIQSASPLRPQLLQAGTAMGMGNPPMGTVDQWNAAYANAKGLTTNPLETNPTQYGALVSATGGGQISVDQYLNALSATGLGVVYPRPMRRSMNFGMGEIVNGLVPVGSETIQ